MGKLDDYAAGRAAGMVLARDIVAESGIDGLEKEIEFCNITGINVGFRKKELEKMCDPIKARTLDTVLIMAVSVLRDEFDFGKIRCSRFIDRFNKKAACLMDDMATWDDYIQVIKEEIGIELVIRGGQLKCVSR